MKIGNPADKPLAPPVAPTPQGPSAPAAPSAAVSPTAGTTVALSPTATTLMTTGATAEFDAEKVSRIAQAIAEGKFTVNPEAIADKLIANAQELLSRPPR
jgi:negative regulator of flagellin synthesis FlgM